MICLALRRGDLQLELPRYSMNYDLKVVPQVVRFSTTSKPKSIEIP
jgi:hypothetical protein